jgi:hypothetical protein
LYSRLADGNARAHGANPAEPTSAPSGGATRREARGRVLPDESGASPDCGAARAVLRSGLERLRQAREAWDEAARACTCPPGLCSRRDLHGRYGE